MANYFVASGGSNTAPYDTWAKAATSLQTALTAASTAGDIVVIQYDGVPSVDNTIAGDTTYTFAANSSLISASNDGGSAYTPTVMGDTYFIGSSSASWTLSLAGAFAVSIYGVTVRMAGTALRYFYLGVDGGSYSWLSCLFWLGTTTGSASIRLSALSSTNCNANSSYFDCQFRFAHASQGIFCHAINTMVSCSLHASSLAISPIFDGAANTSLLECDSCDFSLAGTDIVKGGGTAGHIIASFTNCKVPASATWLTTQSPLNLSQSQVYVFNCASGDTHYDFGYYNALGSVVSTTGIYASGGAKYDGTNGVSWQIDTSSAASYEVPFVTPWIDLYHSGTAAITPKLEIVRSGSATAYDNDEVWAEFSYQGTSGSTKATIVDDRMALAGAPAAQTTGDLGAGDWTGENATSWFGKLNPTSTITPAEIGMLRARVCVGVASQTVYVDPYIRVA